MSLFRTVLTADIPENFSIAGNKIVSSVCLYKFTKFAALLYKRDPDEYLASDLVIFDENVLMKVWDLVYSSLSIVTDLGEEAQEWKSIYEDDYDRFQMWDNSTAD